MIGPHSAVKGSNEMPGRIMINLETQDVKGEFARLKAVGATVQQEPYQPGPAGGEMWLATLADPDGNYFQIASPDARMNVITRRPAGDYQPGHWG